MTLRNRNGTISVPRLRTIQTTYLTKWLSTSYHVPSSFSVICRLYCICNFDCSSPDFNIKKLEDAKCKEPRRRHSLYTEVKRQDGMPSTLDEHIYDEEKWMTLRNRNGTISVPRLQTIQKTYLTF
jgi:hypothetical protein